MGLNAGIHYNIANRGSDGLQLLAEALKKGFPVKLPSSPPPHRVRSLSTTSLQEFTASIRENVLISNVVSHYTGQKLSTASKQFCLCPFHDDKNPSMSIDDNLGLFHCFSCRASGDTIKFVQDIESVSFVEALRQISKISGISFNKDTSIFDQEKYMQKDRIQKVRVLLIF